MTAALAIDGLEVSFLGRKMFSSPQQALKAVKGVDLTIAPGETLGLVGSRDQGSPPSRVPSCA